MLPTDRWGDRTFSNDAEAIDLDADGDLDLILVQSTRRGEWQGFYIQVLIQTDDGWADQTPDRIWPQGVDAPQDRIGFADKIHLADLDSDGDLDFVVTSSNPTFRDRVGDMPLSIGINDGTGHFSPQTPKWLTQGFGWSARDMAVGDFDGDGDKDIISNELNYINERDQTVGAMLSLHRMAPAQ